jgi:sec-independent protein translocase protein TatC
MKRMSFLEHLEELRTRILRSVIGLFVSFIACLGLAPQLFLLFVRPFDMAASKLPYDPPLQLTQITPTEQFMLEYVKIPLLAGIFLASPWIMYQVWAFVAPGLYRRERRWAGPFICSTASLFIAGGLFCYFIALRFALGFLIGLGFDMNVRPMISLTSYYDMFFNLHVGLGVVFQMPVVIFFFTLLRITSPAFLLRHGRYAILIIFVVAALITPTPDVTTMLTFAAPMILLYYVGIAASFLIVMKREGRQFPWRKILWIIGLSVFAVLATLAVMYFAAGFRFVESFPWFVRP